jgi:hypothetical protein
MSSRTGRSSPVSRKGSNNATNSTEQKPGDEDIGVKASAIHSSSSNHTMKTALDGGAAESQSRGICVTSDEINFLVYRYLQESGKWRLNDTHATTPYDFRPHDCIS